MGLPRRERFTSQFTDGLWHAIYPSALLTLCGLPRAERGRGRNWPPNCDECVRVARIFDSIDGSVPAHWGWRRLPLSVSARGIDLDEAA